ncbi:YciI family protein [Chryseobacterium sp. R2A-55]|uniref:YciI family protein n=1 Tax=Chryseobacterium sp. R2A-55 TaxID=2744445 RepID=UPI001F4854F2|nr:YciI family protein [Chryseobacterium sp. R2A-55]
MRTVVFYENTQEGTMEKMMEVFPKHQENEDQFVNAGKIIGIGPFSVPGQGAMGIFTDRESAEEFVKNDPFVQEGLVTYTIKEWMDDLETK